MPSARQTRPSRNGTAAALQADPLFIGAAEDWPVGDELVTLARLTTTGAMKLQDELGKGPPAVSGGGTTDSAGLALVSGALYERNWDPIYRILDLLLVEPWPRGLELRVAARDIGDLIDRGLDLSGLGWLDTIVKNYSAAAAKKLGAAAQHAVEQMEIDLTPPTPPPSLPTGTDEESASSTDSSSP